jgi:glycosyltransferase involved in cell wall biosynthesis
LKSTSRDWVLWIEGDGPELVNYQNLARQLGVIDRCRFLGFCQFDVHGWLMCASDIVVVPSIEDSWGILVDEGLQLGKLVIASDGVGSGNDRVQSGINGYIFPAGNASKLGDLMEKIIDDDTLRLAISELAISKSKSILPQDNAQVLTAMMFSSH